MENEQKFFDSMLINEKEFMWSED